jgi:bifunctional non-homologous end joining protein LigD
MTENISLYYREGGSDKVYLIALEEDPKGWLVNFQYGRRGSSLVTGSKTAKPVSYTKAKQLYDKLIMEKTGKGYTEDTNGKVFSSTVTAPKDTGVRPQLLNEIEESEVMKYINDPQWCAQEKYDGRRRMFIKKGNLVTATNRKGLAVPLDVLVNVWFNKFNGDIIFDGEDMGSNVMIFDILNSDANSNLGYKDRYFALNVIFKNMNSPGLSLAPTAWSTKEKRDLYNKLIEDNAEGIVFKKVDAKYKPGRPNSGGDQLKFKFVASASCVVMKANTTKRSIQVGVFDTMNAGALKTVGNVTVYPNMEIPEVGSIVEVKYLYYFPEGSLFQPVLLGIREDVDANDCILAQLKIKREEVENE